MRWSPRLVAVLVPLACGWEEDASTSAAATDPGHNSSTTLAETGETGDGPPLPPGFWPGVACTPPADDEEPRFYFDLTAGKQDGRDYFRLPFPLDARRKGGGIDLTGFPSPPPDLDPTFGRVAGRWLAHLEADAPGFAVNSAVLFRTSHPVGALGGVHFINVTPGHPDYGQALLGFTYKARGGPGSGNNYLCDNWLAVETIDGVPLEPGTTYAVVITGATKPAGGGRFVQDTDFSAMLQSTAPGEPARRSAWQTFAPLREFLASHENSAGPGLTAKGLIAGTVFTTASNTDVLAGARAAARAAPLYVHDLHLCQSAGEGPCADAPGLTDDERAARRCGPPSADYHEIHGRVRLPIFQEGIPPYAENGGRIDLEDGAPVQRSSVDACFSITLPKKTAPDAGWPALVYAHGTGGSFRSPLVDGSAPALARAGIATLALEGVLHGERRGDTDDDGKVAGLDQQQLVFNVLNPESARDTLIQGAIDQFTAVRLLEEWQDDTLLAGQVLRFDPDALFFLGHSQGANSGALFLPFEPSIRAAVLSGGGGKLPRALLAKQEPRVENPVTGEWLAPRELLQFAFQERPDRPLETAHPMIVLLNTFVNRSDADNTAPLIRRRPPEGVAPKHLLVYIGHVDSYSPLRSAGGLAIAAGTQLADATLFPPPCDGYESEDARSACFWTSGNWLPITPLPASDNIGGVTAVTRMLPAPAGKDGHYVAFQTAEIERIAQFFATALAGGTPTVQ